MRRDASNGGARGVHRVVPACGGGRAETVRFDAIAGRLGRGRPGMTARYTHAADAVLLHAADDVADETLARSARHRAAGEPRSEAPARGACLAA